MIGRKQVSTEAAWAAAWTRIRAGGYDRAALTQRVASTVAAIRQMTAGRRAAFGWSGGKDSLALEVVCRAAGLTACILVITNLEYPAFLQWVTDHMPPELEVVNTGQDLEWLAADPAMLFPASAAIAARWFHAVQHAGQARYARAHALEVLLLGRRRQDGNVIPAPLYTPKGSPVARGAPLADWAHEDVLALLHETEVVLPPTYGWPRGYQVGTGPWPARQWCPSIEAGWAEVYQIDPQVVETAAPRLPSARAYLEARMAGR